MNKRVTQLGKDRDRKGTDKYKLQRQSSKYISLAPLQHDYGPDSQQPDATPEELDRLCSEFFARDVRVTVDQAKAIERATQQQSDIPEWYRQRRLRITASNFGRIARRRDTTPVAKTIKSLLYSRPFDAPSLRWGRTHEDDVRKAYLHQMAVSGQHGLLLIQSGLVIDQKDPCLACSPDNLVVYPTGEVGLVEYKCPYKAAKENLTLEQAAVQLKDFCSALNSCGKLELKRTHPYFYQVQGSLAITGNQWCHFILWTPRGLSIETIQADPDFWAPVRRRLIHFYNRAVLPELVLPRYTIGQPIREPFLAETRCE